MKTKILVIICLCILNVIPSPIIDVKKDYGKNKLGFGSSTPTKGTWVVGDLIIDNSSGTIKQWVCKSGGTFSSYSVTGKTFLGSANIREVDSTLGVMVGQYVTLSAGFSAGQKTVIAKSNRSGVTFTGATSDGSSATVNGVLNDTLFAIGDYVQLSAGFPSTTNAYRVLNIDTATNILTIDGSSNTNTTGIVVTQVKGITVDANATSTESACNVTTTDPTFKYIGQVFEDTVRIYNTTTSTSPTTGALSVSGGIGAKNAVFDSLKIGSSGSNMKDIHIIDGAADTLSFTIGTKTWKFLPVSNQ
jgi:hypothetical protein